jgi:hypothetical protein
MTKKYLCGVSFEHELGETDEIGIYDSIEDLKKDGECWKECGIVEVDVEDGEEPKTTDPHRWVVEQNFNWGKNLRQIEGPKEYLANKIECDVVYSFCGNGFFDITYFGLWNTPQSLRSLAVIEPKRNI